MNEFVQDKAILKAVPAGFTTFTENSFTMKREIRVRFAPSPTGPLHIGGVRTALYNYLFAKAQGGKMILRIEDTDQARFVPGAEDYIIESLEWCGIKFDEGVHVGGPFAPYRQSERKDMYHEYALQLVKSGHAYYAFDTPEELEQLRKDAESRKETFQYCAANRKQMRNSLTLPQDEVQKRIADGTHYVIRIMMPENETVTVNDLIRGEVKVATSQLDDKVLFKSDGMPTYHLANVVDDHLMEITHVIRGEEWLPSAPMHVLLYRSFGWEDTMPQFAHLPLLLKPDGHGKLSKRDGDRLGFPVFPLQWKDPVTGEISSGYRESGYFPEAFINILAFLGWNPGTEQELFFLDELVDHFTLERVHKAGSKFDPEKAKWYNHQYLIRRTDEEIAALFMPVLKEKDISVSSGFVEKVCGLVKERVHFISELWGQSWFFFHAPESYDEQIIKKRWAAETGDILHALSNELEKIETFTKENIDACIKSYIQQHQLNTGQIMNTLRLCMVGASLGPDLLLIMELTGKTETIKRIRVACERIK
jgi:glutamyl-tRNA synthetase